MACIFCYFNGIQWVYEMLAWVKARMWNLFIFDCTCGSSHRSLIRSVCVYHSGVHFITTELIFNALRHVRLDTLLSIGHYVWVCVHCLWRVVLIQKTHAHEYSTFNMVRTEWHRLLCKIRLVHWGSLTLQFLLAQKPIDQPIRPANQNQCETFCHGLCGSFVMD